MKNSKYDQIYKLYKRGSSLEGMRNDDIFNALKMNKIQVVLVYDKNGKERIYNFIPELGRFFKLV